MRDPLERAPGPWGVRVPLAALAALAMMLVPLAACGSDDDGGGGAPTRADLDGKTYSSTEVTGDDLVEQSTITLAFETGMMAVRAGCNTQTAEYEVADGTLRWTGPAASTRMACSPQLEEQDRWLAGLFTDGMTALLDGSALSLAN